MRWDFNTWWSELKTLAEKESFKLDDQEFYFEYYEDGDSPEETLAVELSYVTDDEDDDFMPRFDA